MFPEEPSIWNLVLTREFMVRKGGFEPPRLSAPPPQDGVSASSTTSALEIKRNANQHFIIAKVYMKTASLVCTDLSSKSNSQALADSPRARRPGLHG